MDVNEWGPAAWKFLHAATFAVDEKPTPEMQHHIKQFFEALPHLLPCKICKRHFMEYVDNHPIDTSSRQGLTKWLVDVHNNVNQLRKKPKVPYTQVENKFSYSKTKTYPVNSGAKICILIIFIVIVVAVFAVSIGLMVYSCTKGRCPIV